MEKAIDNKNSALITRYDVISIVLNTSNTGYL